MALLDRARLGGLSIRLALLPMGQTVDYSYRALEVSANGLTMPILVDLAFLLAGLGLTLAGLRRRNWLGFAGAWFTIYYLPVAGIISWHEVFAERFLYLPLIGFCGAAGVGIAALARRPGFRRVVPVAAVVLLAVLATATGLRNEAWASSVNLWKSAVARFPACARAHKALADQYLDDARTDLALEHYQKAVEILPAYLDAHLGVVTVLTAQRKFQLGLDHLEEVVHRWPDDPKVLNTKGLLFESIGEKEKARQTYEEIVKRNPDFAEGYNNLGRFLVEQGDVPGAIKMYEKALEVDPAFTTALLNLEIVYKYGLKDEKKAAYYQERARASARVR